MFRVQGLGLRLWMNRSSESSISSCPRRWRPRVTAGKATCKACVLESSKPRTLNDVFSSGASNLQHVILTPMYKANV